MGMKQSTLKLDKKHVIILTSLFLLIVFMASLLFLYFFGGLGVALQRQDIYTTYFPLSGKLFDIKTENLNSLEFYVRDDTGNLMKTIICKREDEGFGEIIDYINSFRYESWRTDSEISKRANESNWIYIFSTDEYGVDTGHDYLFTPEEIGVYSVWYRSKDVEYFDKLIDLACKYGEEI